MTEKPIDSPEFRAIWKGALATFNERTNINLEHAETLPCLQNIEELIEYLHEQISEYAQDSESSAFTALVKKTFKPLQVLTTTAGDVAGSAGIAVSGSFEAVTALFSKVANSTTRMQAVINVGIPVRLRPIYELMLVCLLNTCAIGIEITERYSEPEGAKTDKEGHWHLRAKVSRQTRAARANIKQYTTELMGGHSGIQEAVSKFDELLQIESSMMHTETMTGAIRIEATTISIEGMTVQLQKDMSQMRTNALESNIRLTVIDDSMRRVENGMTEMKKSRNQEVEKIDAVYEIVRTMASGNQKSESQVTKTSVSAEFKSRKKLEADLEVKGVQEANKAFYNRILGERVPGTTDWILEDEHVKRWLQGDVPFMVVGGESGSGKTFIASRIIEHLHDTLPQSGGDVVGKPNSESASKAAAYFFCRGGQSEESDLKLALKNMAFHLAADERFAMYLRGVVGDLSAARPFSNEASNASDPAQNTAPTSNSDVEAPCLPNEDTTPSGSDDIAVGSTPPVIAVDTDRMDQISDSVRLQQDRRRKEGEAESAWHIQHHWESLFVQRQSEFDKHFYLVIDGLDECDETEAVALCAAINNSASSRTAPHVHVLLLMSGDRMQSVGIQALSVATPIGIDFEANIQAVGQFVRKSLANVWKKSLVRAELREESYRAIMESCAGNFLRASLLVDEVTSFTREDMIQRSLAKLPETTEKAMLLLLERLWRQMSETDRQDFHDILAWVVCAHRELSVAKLDALLTLRTPNGSRIVDLESRLNNNLSYLFSVSGGDLPESNASDDRVGSPLKFISSTLTFKEATGDSNAIHEHSKSIEEQEPYTSTDIVDELVLREKAIADLQNKRVTISHDMISEQIRKHSIFIGDRSFVVVDMRAAVLLRCLETICEHGSTHDDQTFSLARGYCGLYLPEHLLSVSPGEVDSPLRAKISRALLALLRDPKCADRWVECGEGFLADDLLGRPDFQERTMLWLGDEAFQSQLNEEELQWYREALVSPTVTLFKEIAASVARRWLTQINTNPPYTTFTDSFGFLKRFQESKADHGSMQNKSADGRPSDELDKASTKDVLRVAALTGLDQNARWHERIATTIRSELSQYDEAVDLYKKAFALDSDDPVICAALGQTLAEQERYDDALQETETAVGLWAAATERGRPFLDLEKPLSAYLAEARLEFAKLCIQAGKVSEAFEAYDSLTESLDSFDIHSQNSSDWEQIALATGWQFVHLVAHKNFENAIQLVSRINKHRQRSAEEFNVIYRLTACDEDPLLQLGYHTESGIILTEFMNNALMSCARYRDEFWVVASVYVFANILLRLNEARKEDAISMLQAVAEHSHAAVFHKSRAKREVARHFLTKMLQERDQVRWQEVARYADKLVNLVVGEERDMEAAFADTDDCCLILTAWYRLNGLHSRAMACVRSSVLLGINHLSDTDPDNDSMAWWTLSNSLLAMGDTTGAIAAVNMLRSGRFEEKPNDEGSSAAVNAESAMATVVELDGHTKASDNASEEISDEHSMNDAGSTGLRQVDGVVTEDTGPAQGLGAVEMPVRTTASLENKSGPEVDQSGPDGSALATNDSDKIASTVRPGHPFFTCDGCCFGAIPNNALMWRCSYCIADFCVNCHELIKNRNMKGWNICDSLHHHIEIPEVPAKCPEGMMRVGDEYVLISEWVGELRGKWIAPKADSE